MNLKKMTLNINGADRMFICDPEKDTLAGVLRRLGLTGTKIGCGTGVCGACSVILDGKVIRSCTRKMKNVKEYSSVMTIEGIGTVLHPHPLQYAWVSLGAVQCGFCVPGFIVSAYGLLQENPDPSREEVRDWFQKHRNVCRCTGYRQIVDAVMEAAAVMRGEKTLEDITYDWKKDIGNFYGKPLIRPNAMAKACGVCDFGDDIEMKMPPETLKVVLVMPRVASHVAQSRSSLSANPYITYCINCRDVFISEEKPAVHILDLVYGKDHDSIKLPDLSQRRRHRTALKEALLKEIWNEEMSVKPDKCRYELRINTDIRRKMNRLKILEEDLCKVIEYGEKAGRRTFDPERGTYKSYRELGSITCWAEYRMAGQAYEIVNVYSHRMKIVLEAVWNGKKTDADL